MSKGYSQLRPEFWQGETGMALQGHKDAQILALYLISSPHNDMTGLFKVSKQYIAIDTGLTFDEIDAALAVLRRLCFAEYDPNTGLVFVVNMAREQIGRTLSAGDKRRKAIERHINKYRSSHLAHLWMDAYADDYGMDPLAPEFRNPLEGASASSEVASETKEGASGTSEGASKGLPHLHKGYPTIGCPQVEVEAEAESEAAQVTEPSDKPVHPGWWLAQFGRFPVFRGVVRNREFAEALVSIAVTSGGTARLYQTALERLAGKIAGQRHSAEHIQSRIEGTVRYAKANEREADREQPAPRDGVNVSEMIDKLRNAPVDRIR